MTSSTASAQSPSTPTPAQLTENIEKLVTEVHEALSTDRWAVLDSRTERTKWLLYDAASLRHCCVLLSEIEFAASTGQELTVRVLGRVHLEAWLTALYLHFGGYQALTRLARDTRYQLEKTADESQRFNQWLIQEKKSAKRRIKKIRRANEGILRWNQENPDKPPKKLHEEPSVPRLNTTNIDLSDRIKDFGANSAQQLSVSGLVDILSSLSIEKGFSTENFRALYIIYRMLSMGALHPTLNIYGAYFVPPLAEGGFVRTAPVPLTPSQAGPTRITALYSTAFLASAVLGDAGCPTPVADKIKAELTPDPSQGAGWTPNA